MTRIDLAKEIAQVIKENMEFNVKSWMVQLGTGLKEGTIWGQQAEIKDFEAWRLAV